VEAAAETAAVRPAAVAAAEAAKEYFI
jgi:hypothetical protein